MEHIGHPLIGDPVYRRRRGEPVEGLPDIGRQALHARRLTFSHPISKEEITVEVAAPADFLALLEWVKNSQ
jgi:23S rRNA pseudouridine1911/1915/1917 synthase